MERSQMRRLLWRWGRVLEYCRSKQQEMQGFQEIIDTQRGLSSPQYDGMPRGSTVGNPTERAAFRVSELNDRYAGVIIELAKDCEKELRFMRAMDELITELPSEQQKTLELKYKGGHAWAFIALRMCLSIDRAKHIDTEAVDNLMKGIEVSTF